MAGTPHILSTDEMKEQYGSFYYSSPTVDLDRRRIPQQFWPLVPYAEFWGHADDATRERLVKQAPPDVRQSLKDAVSAFEDALEDWLTGPEADKSELTDEYVAFAAMVMAADLA